MEKLEELLVRWKGQAPQRLAMGKLRTDPAFQPRDPRIAAFADRTRLEAESDRHVARLAECASGGDLEPLLVALIDGRHYVIDGHHRLLAMRRAMKHDVPARVLPVGRREAVLVSKLVNCSGAKLPMNPEQQRECAWQYLADVTRGGRLTFSKEVSRRAIGRAFGTSRETIGAMLRKLPHVDADHFSPDTCDPGTGWPRWRHVKGNAIRDRFADVPEEERERCRDERRAAKIAAMIQKDGLPAYIRSVELLRIEALSEATAALEQANGDEADDY